MTKITRATISRFVKAPGLLIECRAQFDGMVDGRVDGDKIIREAKRTTHDNEHNLGISGLFVSRTSGNTFEAVDTPEHYGFSVSNCCGKWRLLRRK